MALPEISRFKLDGCTIVNTHFVKKGDAISGSRKKVQDGPKAFGFLLDGKLHVRFNNKNSVYDAENPGPPGQKNIAGKYTRKALQNNTTWLKILPDPEFIPFQRKVYWMDTDDDIVLDLSQSSFVYVARGSAKIQQPGNITRLRGNHSMLIEPSVRTTVTALEPTIFAYVWKS